MGANAACVSVHNERELKEILQVNPRVIALFYAAWCPFCIRFLPVFKRYAEQEGRSFVIVQDDRQAMAEQYSLKVYPTVLFFESGTVSKRLDGVAGIGLDEKQLAAFVTACPRS
jgi:thiol-disulfide isomerase/thioredoxin